MRQDDECVGEKSGMSADRPGNLRSLSTDTTESVINLTKGIVGERRSPKCNPSLDGIVALFPLNFDASLGKSRSETGLKN
jgi:hypothetical protein